MGCVGIQYVRYGSSIESYVIVQSMATEIALMNKWNDKCLLIT